MLLTLMEFIKVFDLKSKIYILIKYITADCKALWRWEKLKSKFLPLVHPLQSLLYLRSLLLDQEPLSLLGSPGGRSLLESL